MLTPLRWKEVMRRNYVHQTKQLLILGRLHFLSYLAVGYVSFLFLHKKPQFCFVQTFFQVKFPYV